MNKLKVGIIILIVIPINYIFKGVIMNIIDYYRLMNIIYLYQLDMNNKIDRNICKNIFLNIRPTKNTKKNYYVNRKNIKKTSYYEVYIPNKINKQLNSFKVSLRVNGLD